MLWPSLVLTRPSYISFVQRVWDRSIDTRWLPWRRVLCLSRKLLDLPRASLICHNQSLAFALANSFNSTVTELAAVAGKSNFSRTPWGEGAQHHGHQQNSARIVLAPALTNGYSAALPQPQNSFARIFLRHHYWTTTQSGNHPFVLCFYESVFILFYFVCFVV